MQCLQDILICLCELVLFVLKSIERIVESDDTHSVERRLRHVGGSVDHVGVDFSFVQMSLPLFDQLQ